MTTAYYLGRSGHEVVVVDRQTAAGMETSFANAGQVSPGYSPPWAGPSVPIKAARWLLMRYRPFVLWPRPDPDLAVWLAQMLANCNEQAYRVNKGGWFGSRISRDCLRHLRRETGITYDDRQQGTLQLFRTQKQLDHVGDDTAVLDETNVPYEVLDRDGCVRAERSLGACAGKNRGRSAAARRRNG